MRWLGPDDIAENGRPIKQNWQPVLEYHEANPSFPPDPNIFNQKPAPQFTEVRWYDPIPTSTMLVMDVSESMIRDIDKAKEGLCLYLNLFRPGLDRGGLVEFAGAVLDTVAMTSDTSILKNTIRSATLNPGTALYEGLMTGVNLIKSETGRRAIIVYTDGGNNVPPFSPQAVIDSARANNLPIYTIALGTSTEDDSLKKIADKTSGLFFKAATAEQMKAIYGKLSVMMQNYYVMAHASPDPNFNRTWRLVDVTANLPGVSGRAVGRYQVPGPPPQFVTDLSVILDSKTDTTVVVAGDSIHAVKPGEIFNYIIRYKNFGPDRAENVRLIHFLPDSGHFVSASVVPQFATKDSLTWIFPGIMPGAEDSIFVTVRFGNAIPVSLTEIISKATIQAPDDAALENNSDTDTIRVLFPPAPPKYDLSLSQTVVTDTATVIDGKLYPAVVQGESYQYQIKIFNHGPAPASNFTIWDVFPDSVALSLFNIPPTQSGLDTVFWQFPFLEAGDSIVLSFQANVASLLPYLPFPLANISGLSAANDSLTQNNSSATLVYGIARQKPVPLLTDLSLKLTSTTAQKIIVAGDTVNAVMPGETFQYQINIANLGTNHADTVSMIHILPDSVHFINSLPAPQRKAGKTLLWEFLDWQPSESKAIFVTVQLAESIPANWTQITSQASLSSRSDTSEANNSDADTIKIIVQEPPPLKIYDLAINQLFVPDTTIIIGNERFPAIFADRTHRYTLKVTNLGPDLAADFEVWDVIPDSVTFHNFSIPVSRQMTDTLFWQFDSLASGDSLKINFDAMTAPSFPFYPYPLTNESGVISRDDRSPENNRVASLIYVIKKSRISRFATDVSLTMYSITDSTIISNQDTTNFVYPGDDYQYFISIQNKGPYQADSVRLVHILPDLVSYISATVMPTSWGNGIPIWKFDSIAPFQTIAIGVNVKLSEQTPQSLNQLLSRAEIFASNDSTPNNNYAEDLVHVIFRELPPAVRNFNLAVEQEIRGDTTIIIAGEPAQAILRGASYAYQLTVKNFGPVAAQNFSIWEVPPDLVSITGQSVAPTKIVNDTLFWQIDRLNVGSSITIILDAKLADALPFTPVPLVNRVGLIAAQDTSAADNFSEQLAYGIARPGDPRNGNVDIAVLQNVETDSSAVENNETKHYVRSGETYSYSIRISNESQIAAEDVVVTDFLPDSISASNYQPTPKIVSGDSIRWHLGYLLPQAKAVVQYDATVRSTMPIGKNLLTHRVKASAANEDPERLSNNADNKTVYNLVKPAGGWQPLITASPEKAKVGSYINVRVNVNVPVEDWDIYIYLTNGQIDQNYFDQFIAATRLTPNQWTEVNPQYNATRMYSSDKIEPVIFELRVFDVFGEFKTARDTVKIESDDDFIVRRNLFIPDQDQEKFFPIEFKISSDRVVRIDIYDITGTKISRILEEPRTAGEHTYTWNGLTEHGQKIGSGFYILTIHTGEYSAWKKLIIVR